MLRHAVVVVFLLLGCLSSSVAPQDDDQVPFGCRPVSGVVLKRVARAAASALAEYAKVAEEELSAHRAAAARFPGSAFATALDRRVKRANAALQLNTELLTEIVQEVEAAADEALYGDLGIALEDTTELEAAVARPRLRFLGGDGCRDRDFVAAYTALDSRHSREIEASYSTAHDVLSHLARDWAFSTNSAAAAVLAQRQQLLTRLRSAITTTGLDRGGLSALVPGSGVGGVSELLTSSGLFSDVLSTECSPALLAVQLWMSTRAATSDQPRWFAPWAAMFGNVISSDGDSGQFEEYRVDGPARADTEGRARHWLLLADLFDAPKDSGGALDDRTAFDVVFTSFVIDALVPSATRTSSFLDVLDRIDKLTAPGGLWVNVGPLHYHSQQTRPKLAYDELVSYFVTVHRYEIIDGPVDLGHPGLAYSRPIGSSMTPQLHAAVFSILRKPHPSP